MVFKPCYSSDGDDMDDKRRVRGLKPYYLLAVILAYDTLIVGGGCQPRVMCLRALRTRIGSHRAARRRCWRSPVGIGMCGGATEHGPDRWKREGWEVDV